jgi:hypothetical protein
MITKERTISYLGGDAQFSVRSYANSKACDSQWILHKSSQGEGFNEVEQLIAACD